MKLFKLGGGVSYSEWWYLGSGGWGTVIIGCVQVKCLGLGDSKKLNLLFFIMLSIYLLGKEVHILLKLTNYNFDLIIVRLLIL